MELRRIELPTKSVRSKISREFDGILSNGWSSHRHITLLTIWYLAEKMGHQVPVGLDWPLDILFEGDLSRFNVPYLDALKGIAENGEDYDGPDQDSLMLILTKMWMCVKCVEVSDTPNWFRLTDSNIDEIMRYCDVSSPDVGCFVFPFDGFCLEIPEGCIDSDKTSPDGSVSIHVAKAHLRAGRYQSSPECVGGSKIVTTNVNKLKDGDYVFIGVRMFGESWGIGDDDATTIIKLYTPDNFTLDKIEGEFYGRYDEEWEEEDRFLTRLVVGFLAYHRSLGYTIAEGASKKRKKGRIPTSRSMDIGKVLNARTWLAGSKVKINGRAPVRRSGESVVREESKSAVVSGHLRRYRCGPRNDWHYELRRVKPHVRKSGRGPVLGHSYEVGE